jgi:Zn-dependent protease with chaperone function
MQARGDFAAGALALYVLTAALELPAILARCAAIYVTAAIALKLTGHTTGPAAEWAKLAVAPTLWSAAALVNPAGGGWWWQQRMGGRRPSTREYAAYRAAMEALQAGTTIPLPEPGRWFVIDESTPDAAVCGDTLMLTKALLESPHLPAALAHQLGHLQGIDGRLTDALNRLVLGGEERPRATVGAGTGPTTGPAGPSPRTPAQERETPRRRGSPRRTAVALLRGGLALRLTSIGWGNIWREAEYEADRFAARIGWAEELAAFLEAEAPKHDHPIPLVWLSDHTHPPTELRIDALRALSRKQPAAP